MKFSRHQLFNVYLNSTEAIATNNPAIIGLAGLQAAPFSCNRNTVNVSFVPSGAFTIAQRLPGDTRHSNRPDSCRCEGRILSVEG